MTAPAAVLAAIEKVSGTVVCPECDWWTCTVEYSELLDAPVIRHVNRHAFGIAAAELAEYVMSELARHVQVGDYCEEMPVHLWAMS